MGDLTANFSRAEFRCNCGKCGLDTIDAETLSVLQRAREDFGRSITITSGYRCRPYNQIVGGAPYSQHLYGRAADIKVAQVRPQLVFDYLDDLYPVSLGLGLYKTFVHVDTRTSGRARWNLS